MHPSNKYAEKQPDFNILASLYPSFKQYVIYGANKIPRIDWTDFAATRELTRVLLDHDHGVKWWIPDGQLCPTVPNRSNYLHWIKDLLTANPAPWHADTAIPVVGLDIGTGANCIYPLLGAALNGWHFVGTDITLVALEWAKHNVESNPQFSGSIEIRSACSSSPGTLAEENSNIDCGRASSSQSENPDLSGTRDVEDNLVNASKNELFDSLRSSSISNEPVDTSKRLGQCTNYAESAPVLFGVVSSGENFDFCMCNPPFFENIEQAGANPYTACGGTVDEMVCPGGELAFITHIVDDSLKLRNSIQWYTSMVGRKVNLKILITKLRSLGVTMLRTTEFVQGRTSRWGIAWSYALSQKANAVLGRAVSRSNTSFMLEGIGRQWNAIDVLRALESELQVCGVCTALEMSSYSVTVSLMRNSMHQWSSI